MISVVGIGAGSAGGMTADCRAALDVCDVIVGYAGYVGLVAPLCPGKRVFATGMTGEAERCRAAFELAAGGERVAVVCSGDAGVYGMAGLIYELSPDYPGVDIRVVPGVTAASSGAALLGAPLGHDFCVISLSDLLTPWETIEKRLECAARGDFCIALYNPSSKKRGGHLKRACDVLLRHKPRETICGAARNIGREGESAAVMDLAALREYEADMFTTAFVGNSATKVVQGKMVTPRGYAVG